KHNEPSTISLLNLMLPSRYLLRARGCTGTGHSSGAELWGQGFATGVPNLRKNTFCILFDLNDLRAI
ncbi:MAG: hypothetical protein KDA74_15545, partial [Planctomycetaceae bacterium]|nr:hypothetical protein [Planctomycetaceae bacterium]